MRTELHPESDHPLNAVVVRLDELLMAVRAVTDEAKAVRADIDEALRYLRLQDAERAARRALDDLKYGGGH